MQLKRIENYFTDVVKRKRTGFFAALLRFFLLIFSRIFQLFVKCRNWAFDHGWLRRYSPPVPLVISVGNIVMGGTGKTPFTLMLAKEFYRVFPLAILTRGYRSCAESIPQPICLSAGNGKGPLYPASFCGDEPYLLAQNLPEAFVFVGKNRHKTSIMAAKAGVKMIILDDGMQHRRLSRDLDIIVMDAGDLFGLGYHLPRGFLREGPESLSRANLIVLNHIDSPEHFAEVKARISPFSSAPVIGTRMQVSNIIDFKGEKIESLLNKKVGIFCGIARPEYFEKTVEDRGGEVIGRYFVSDHCDFDPLILDSFSNQCRNLGAEVLLCTEKDRVKFTEPLSLTLPVAWLQIELSIVEGLEAWKIFINSAKSDILRRM